jgi:hypothetical protein
MSGRKKIGVELERPYGTLFLALAMFLGSGAFLLWKAETNDRRPTAGA